MERNRRYAAGFAAIGAAVLLLLYLNLNIGSVNLSPREIFAVLSSGDAAGVQGGIIWNIRLPRMFAAMILGGALAVSGFLLQTFFLNPIAGPFVLGISSGSKLVLALVMVACMIRGRGISSAAMICAAFAGALGSMLVVLLISGRVKRMSVLVICGVMTGYICSAVTDFVVTFADDSSIVNLHNWAMGSFSGMNWDHVGIMAAVGGAALFLTFLLAKPMSAWQLGETYAAGAGVRLKVFRAEMVLLSSVLSGLVTAFAGPVSFVGIAVPHIMRGLFGTARPQIMIPACFLGGASFCLFCDLLARTLFAPAELNLSSVTAVFGAPIVIWTMLRRSGRGK
ncbi:MAG: iron ABC transporter permease [Lachnospiraceae bacterium]|nr:iron ABC transporter permease [Lachnospiraceae bacterium]